MRESFLKYLQFEKRYSKHTIQSYLTDLNNFYDFLEEQHSGCIEGDINHNIVRSWIVTLVEYGLQPKSINRKIATLRSYFKFLLKREVIVKDPMLRIKALKTSRKLPQFVNEESMQMLTHHREMPSDFEGLRDLLIIELLYGTGIRLAELIGLKEADVNPHDRTIKVIGKRNKERIIPFTASLQQFIVTYLRSKKDKGLSNMHDHLIVTDTGEPSYPMMIYRTVKKHLDNITTIEKRSPHVLRHTYATHLLNKGAELNAVKDLLGHTSLAATQVYTHNSLEKLKSAFDQAHPKA